MRCRSVHFLTKIRDKSEKGQRKVYMSTVDDAVAKPRDPVLQSCQRRFKAAEAVGLTFLNASVYLAKGKNQICVLINYTISMIRRKF